MLLRRNWLGIGFSFLLLCLAWTTVHASARLVSLDKLDGFHDIETYRLPNGLTIVIWADPSAKQTAIRTWYTVGSLSEKPGITGIAHLFEHMMLRPSKFAPSGSLSFERSIGANVGATTRFKTTDFYLTVAPEKLEAMLQFQADIMKNLPLSAAMLAKEKEAVRSEYLMWDNSPYMLILPVLTEIAYKGHAAQYFVIGQRADLKKITAKDCIDFYQNYYAPNNAILVVTGNVDTKQALSSVEKYYGHISRGKDSIIPPDQSILPKGRIETRTVPGNSYPVAITFPLPFNKMPNSDDSALELAMAILFGGDASLAGEELINRQKLAADMGYDLAGLGFYFVNSTLTADTGDKAVKMIDQAIASLQNLSDESFKRYAVAKEADLLRALQSPTQRAETLGIYLTHRNGISALRTDLNASKMLSLSQVKAAASKYLNVDHRFAVVGRPAKAGK